MRALVLLALAWPASAIEISTGKMLGSGYDARSFYVREGRGGWRKTYTGREFRPEAAGRMMNLRIAQGVFDDEWLVEAKFDPEANTSRLIAALYDYRAHGILSISVSLQAGNPSYERSTNIKRIRDAKLGPGKGMLASAFRGDGSLKPAWMKRLLRLQRELDRRGMMLNVIAFYGHQDELLENTQAIDQGVRNLADWLIANNCRNVIFEIANEHDVKAFDHDRYIHNEMGKLIELARARFTEKKAPFRLPISASTGGSMRVYEGVRGHADLVIIHGNNAKPEAKRRRVAELAADSSMPGPIYMNEDDNGRETTLAHLKSELDSCDAAFESGGSWGYMPWVQLQVYPFRHFRPAASSKVSDDMPESERDPAYFKAVLEHVRKLVYR